MIIRLPILTTSRIHFSFRRLGECTFWTWEWKGQSLSYAPTLSPARLLYGDNAEIRFFAVQSLWFWVSGYRTIWRIQGSFDSSYSGLLNVKYSILSNTSQDKLCTWKMELALEVKFYLDFHWVTLPWWPTQTKGSDVKYVFPLTNGSVVKYVFLRCPLWCKWAALWLTWTRDVLVTRPHFHLWPQSLLFTGFASVSGKWTGAFASAHVLATTTRRGAFGRPFPPLAVTSINCGAGEAHSHVLLEVSLWSLQTNNYSTTHW